MVSPSEKKVLMRQEAESKLLAQANSREPEVRLVKIRSGKGEYKNLTEKQQPTLTELSFYNGIQTSKSQSYLIIIGGNAAGFNTPSSH